MSWLINVVNKAAEVSGGSAVTRTVMNYADTVVHHVSEGARVVHDRLGVQNPNNLKLTLRSLEENAVSCRGSQRIELLKRWLIALKRAKGVDDTNVEQAPALMPTNDPMVLYFDSGLGGEPMNFWDAFLRSEALEGLTISMILEPPNDEEFCLLLEIFGLCLTDGKEVCNALLNNIQDLGRSFSRFQDEVLIKHEEMLQFAQSAIAGLKVSADVARIDAEASILKKKFDDFTKLIVPSDVGDEAKMHKAATADLEVGLTVISKAFKEALGEIRLCSKLEALLLEKKSLNMGDTPESHFQKIDKLKVLAESLANCSVNAEKRISDHRHQKEEAIDFRVAKAKEVIEYEKELTAEISVLQKQRDDLEAELKKVNVRLSGSVTRLKKIREERDKFDEASNEILMRLKIKEDDLLKSVASCKVETDVIQTWINFLEDSWLMQSSYKEQNEKQIDAELEKYGKHIVKLIGHHVVSCKGELRCIINQIKTSASNLKDFTERSDMIASADTSFSMEQKSKKFLEEEYLKLEAKILSIFTITDEMKALLGDRQEDTSRGGELAMVTNSFDDIDRMREELGSIDRMILDIETTTVPVRPVAPSTELVQKNTLNHPWKLNSFRLRDNKPPKPPVVVAYQELEADAEVAMLEAEFHKDSKGKPTEDILGWEFDG